MLRSLGSDSVILTTLSNRYALPCWPRKFCDTSVHSCTGFLVGTDPAQDVIVVRQVGLAGFATVDARRVEVDVVRESHYGWCEA